MATVYLAYDLRHDRPVALKVPRERLQEGVTILDRALAINAENTRLRGSRAVLYAALGAQEPLEAELREQLTGELSPGGNSLAIAGGWTMLDDPTAAAEALHRAFDLGRYAVSYVSFGAFMSDEFAAPPAMQAWFHCRDEVMDRMRAQYGLAALGIPREGN